MKPILFAAAMILAATISSVAAPINGAGSFTNTGAPNTDGSPFWDQGSYDGTNCNVGYFLMGGYGSCGNQVLGTTSGSALNLGAANVDTYSNAGAATAFTISAGNYSFILLGSITGAGNFEVGYRQGGIDTALFKSSSSIVGNTYDLNTGAAFSLYIKSDGFTFRSDDASGLRNAAFHNSSTGMYYFGFEDRDAGGDHDYNDMIISMKVNESQTPEPGTWVMLGIGLVSIGAARFRKK